MFVVKQRDYLPCSGYRWNDLERSGIERSQQSYLKTNPVVNGLLILGLIPQKSVVTLLRLTWGFGM